MKTLAAWVLGVSAVFVVNGAAMATGFNDRGMLFVATVEAGSAAPADRADATPGGFKKRGQQFTVQAPAGSEKPRRGAYITASGFNDRSYEKTGSWVETLTESQPDS